MDDPAGSDARPPSDMAGVGDRPERQLSAHARGSRRQEHQPDAQLRRRMQILKNQGKQERRPHKRGAVKKAIVKDLKDTGKAFCCSSATSSRDADSLLRDLPFPTKTEATATIWPKMDTPLWEL